MQGIWKEEFVRKDGDYWNRNEILGKWLKIKEMKLSGKIVKKGEEGIDGKGMRRNAGR